MRLSASSISVTESPAVGQTLVKKIFTRNASYTILTFHDFLSSFFTLAASLYLSMTSLFRYFAGTMNLYSVFYLYDKNSSFQAAEQGSEIVVKQVLNNFECFSFWGPGQKSFLSLIIFYFQAVSRLNSVSATASPYPNRLNCRIDQIYFNQFDISFRRGPSTVSSPMDLKKNR